MSSNTKKTEVNTNNPSRVDYKPMMNTFSQLHSGPERKTDDMITSRAMDDSTLQNAEYSDIGSRDKDFIVQE